MADHAPVCVGATRLQSKSRIGKLELPPELRIERRANRISTAQTGTDACKPDLELRKQELTRANRISR
jgi:hypothetical protein